MAIVKEVGSATVATPVPKGDVVSRLRRIEGQVAGIRRMHEDGRYCIEVLDQLAAARRALEATALRILEDHVNGCVQAAVEGGEGEAKVSELLEAVHRYVRSI
jgi:CsoR family transcriptional regulator, copper-sensing transcriptional repressor